MKDGNRAAGRREPYSAGASSVRKGDDGMAIAQEQVQGMALERDKALKSLADKEAELSAFQKVAQDAAEDHRLFQEWAKAEIAKAACPPAQSPISMNWTMYDKRGAQVD